jgi:hypothetical protein
LEISQVNTLNISKEPEDEEKAAEQLASNDEKKEDSADDQADVVKYV